MLKEVKYQWATFLKQLLYRRFFIDKETRSLGYPGQFGGPQNLFLDRPEQFPKL